MTLLSSISAILIWTLVVLMILKYVWFILSFTLWQMRTSGVNFGNRVIEALVLGTIINMVRIPYLYVKFFFLRIVFGLK